MVARENADDVDQLFAQHGRNVYHEVGGFYIWFVLLAHMSLTNVSLCYQSFVVPEELFLSAPFPVYRTEQRVGDFVLVPSQCLHQVKNNGGRTTKIAWNRITPDSLITGIRHCLSRYKA
jgi:hypothetical protein